MRADAAGLPIQASSRGGSSTMSGDATRHHPRRSGQASPRFLVYGVLRIERTPSVPTKKLVIVESPAKARTDRAVPG